MLSIAVGTRNQGGGLVSQAPHSWVYPGQGQLGFTLIPFWVSGLFTAL